MARDRANIRLDMWADQDWRDLSSDAQHLYMLLLSHPTLSYAGVADWKPGRVAAMTRGKTVASVESAGMELQCRQFIWIDGASEEVLVRSYVKHDGLMKQPRLVVSMTNAYAAIASRTIREILAFEVQKLRDREPNLNAWTVKQVETLLKAKATDIRTFTPPVTPELTPAFTPNVGESEGLHTSTSTSTSTEASLPTDGGKLKETRLPADWAPTAAHFEAAKTLGVNLVAEAASFRAHADTHDRHAARWNSAFTTWLKKAKPQPAGQAVITPMNEWMFNR